jgi:hypothetical protein
MHSCRGCPARSSNAKTTSTNLAQRTLKVDSKQRCLLIVAKLIDFVVVLTNQR